MKRSAGILPYRIRAGALEVFLVHPGGPFWVNKDAGAWSIAKGEYEEPEDALQAALREFREETGFAPQPPFLPLSARKQRSGKTIEVWATTMDCDASRLVSNTFRLEWPKGSGQYREYPEVDHAAWFGLDEAARRIQPAQQPFIDELRDELDRAKSPGAS